VLSAILATMLAMTLGTRVVVFTAAALYVLAGLATPGPSPSRAIR
jgi:hypothetical protein